MATIEKLVERIDDPDGPFFTISQVAIMLERSKDTIRRWCQSEELSDIPNHKMPLGEGTHENAFVWLYTETDVARIKEFSSGINPKGGRPPKEK